ncbi:ABC transporter ATP-binding protein [Corynebacterium sp. 320]|uniref:ATP-binding cassette domain-containing protein n=1 Tax=Corynebacterium TaxID=1716 RepID=UPI00125CCB64|nr:MULTISPECIES: ABC transporter ATP-binding protein [Corynebacterium]KAB1504287.1 ABC transporter ATP-binding protein [Corynebacterium sp. 320]KAB1552613.1 ABC transporter ATP-binding protein [Corynebacterium sp. 321]KAB1554169.1 ABC transporter ATP-binding protein [Corynebacterium sp. 319]KAB3528423.1 ABC transporter ATP-binding protein [Corynebacterium sp. 250]QNP91963.1 ABC transporter ATP-binding protein [Corynebacterium zhongnanshanii]
MTMFEVNQLRFAYSRRKFILDEINLHVEQGEIVGLWGGNGAGKSTLLKLCSGLLKPTSGSIRIDNEDVSTLNAHKKILFLGGNDTVPEYLTGKELIDTFSALYGQEIKQEDYDKLIRLFQLDNDDNQLIENYSHGMKKKIQLLAAVLLRRKLTILDETLNGLDEQAMDYMVGELAALSRDSAVVIASHDRRLLSKVSTRLVVLNNASIVYDGDVEAGLQALPTC